MTSSGLGLLAEAAADGVLVRAPAKINLCLGVGSVRDDGFHPLATVYQAIGLFDDVRVRPADRTTISVSTEGIDISEVPIDDSNLAVRAAMLLARHHKLDEAVDIHIHKRIPVAGDWPVDLPMRLPRWWLVTCSGNQHAAGSAGGVGSRARQRRPVLHRRRHGDGRWPR